MGNIGDTLLATASKLKEKLKALNRARNISTSYKEPTVLGLPVKLVNGLYYPVLPNGVINASEGGYTSHDLDRGIGLGNAEHGRIFKRSDGTWRFADGTIITSFKSPTLTAGGTQTKKLLTPALRASQKKSSNRTTSQSIISLSTTSLPNVTNNYTQIPTSTGMTYSGTGWRFEIPRLLQNPFKDWDSYISQPIVLNTPSSINYDTNYIRGFRGQGLQGYRDVNSYLTWLLNNKDSDDYKLFMLNGYFNTTGDDLDYGLISLMLASLGIRGNLGRRDSRRLGNVLTRLRNQSTAGTPENAQFLLGVVSSYNLNKNSYVNPGTGKVANNAILGEDGLIQFLDNSGLVTLNPYSAVENSKPSWLDRATLIATRHLTQPLPIRMGNIMTSIYGRRGFNSGANG